jgi:hypothetical protein
MVLENKRKGGEMGTPYPLTKEQEHENALWYARDDNKTSMVKEILSVLKTKIDNDKTFKKRIQTRFNEKFKVPAFHAMTTSSDKKSEELNHYLSGYGLRDTLAEDYKDVDGVQQIVDDHKILLDTKIEKINKSYENPETSGAVGGRRRKTRRNKRKSGRKSRKMNKKTNKRRRSTKRR